MQIMTYKNVTDIKEDEWNAIVGEDQLICTHQYLKAIEQSNINDCDYFYIVAYDSDEIIAHICTYSIGFDLAVFAQGASKKIVDSIRKVLPNFLILKLFECGTPVALGNTFSFKNGINWKEVIKQFGIKMEEIAESQGCGLILLRDFVDAELDQYNCLEGIGFSRVENLPDTILKLRWDSFEDYLESFKALYRREFLKRLDKLNCDEITVQVTDEFSEYTQDLLKLWQNVYDRATEYRREMLTLEYFKYLDIYMQDRTKMILIKKDNSIIGFGLMLIDDKTLRPLYLGLDYDLNEQYCIYFNIYYSAIRMGIEEKKESIEFGITTYHNKMDLGVFIEPLYMYMKHRNRVLNPIFTKAFKLMTPKIEMDVKTHHFNESSKKKESKGWK